jgi:hypothetical protein
MESLMILPADPLKAAMQIIDAGDERGVRLRLLGGLAFKRLCPSANGEQLYRKNKDIDLVGRREDTKEIMKTLENLGYKPRDTFNKLNMGQRLIYYDMDNKRRVDVFLDEFVMCHKFNFKQKLLPGMYTLPLTDLVMTKLQVVEATDKEYRDLMAAFGDHDVAEKGINGRQIAEACARDWGLYTTFRRSLTGLKDWAKSRDLENNKIVVARIDRLLAEMESEPKSLGWKVRSRVGEKARWYELPGTDTDAVLA